MRPRVSRAARDSTERGRWRSPNTAVLYFQFGTLSTRPRRRSRSPSRTTSSADNHSHFGRPDMSMPARSWYSVRVYPGQSAQTRTPYGRTACAIDSLKLVTQALLAEYVEPGIMAAKPATEETLTISPRRRAI